MDRIIKKGVNDTLPVKLVAANGSTRNCVITLTEIGAVMILPDYLDKRADVISAVYPKINHAVETAKYKIEGQQYIGTVGSLANEAMVDLYYITREWQEGDSPVFNERFMLAIPSLSILPDAGSVDYNPTVELKGVMLFVDNINKTRSDTLAAFRIKTVDDDAALPYLDDTTDIKDIPSLTTKAFAIPGMFYQHSSFIGVTKYIEGVGEVNTAGNDDIPGQVIVLGKLSDIFVDTTDLSLSLSTIIPYSIGRHRISNPKKVKISSGVLAIPMII